VRRRVPEIPGPRLSARKRQISVTHLLPRAYFFFDAEPLSPRRFGEAHRSKLLRFVVDHDVDDRGMVRALSRNETTETKPRKRESLPPFLSRETSMFAVGVNRRDDEIPKKKHSRRRTSLVSLMSGGSSRRSRALRSWTPASCAWWSGARRSAWTSPRRRTWCTSPAAARRRASRKAPAGGSPPASPSP